MHAGMTCGRARRSSSSATPSNANTECPRGCAPARITTPPTTHGRRRDNQRAPFRFRMTYDSSTRAIYRDSGPVVEVSLAVEQAGVKGIEGRRLTLELDDADALELLSSLARWLATPARSTSRHYHAPPSTVVALRTLADRLEHRFDANLTAIAARISPEHAGEPIDAEPPA